MVIGGDNYYLTEFLDILEPNRFSVYKEVGGRQKSRTCAYHQLTRVFLIIRPVKTCLSFPFFPFFCV